MSLLYHVNMYLEFLILACTIYILASMELPTNFTRDVIMKAPTSDIMGSMTRSILTLGSYDKEKESLEMITGFACTINAIEKNKKD